MFKKLESDIILTGTITILFISFKNEKKV